MPYDPDLFRGAAAFYDRYRAPYADAAIDFVAEQLGLHAGARLLDLGCGPGTLARRLASRVGEVVALDPSEAMLAEARRLAALEGATNITWIQAGSEEVSQLDGPIDAVVMGQTFHWMDRDQVLRDLDALLVEGGGLALINPGRRQPQESWEVAARACVARHARQRPPHPQRSREPKHEPALRRSVFEIVADVEFGSTIRRDIPSILGAIYSMSFSEQHLFEDRIAAFEADLEATLRALRPDGVFQETLETGVIVARR